MKKIILSLILVIAMLFSLCSCSALGTLISIIRSLTEGSDVITNDGAGLPSSVDGVFDVDFTIADIKNVTMQGSYIDGCPTVGEPDVLVIPVEFSDVTAQSRGYTTDALKNAFEKGGKCDYYSVYDYYYTSSYGQLKLDVTVLDTWFRPKYNSSYYEKQTMDYYGEDVFIGDQMIMDEALAYLDTIMDLSEFDSDGNGVIDSVVLINTLDIGDDDYHWAYRYWNIYTDDDGFFYEYDEVSANDYLWASYQFLFQTYDDEGYESFDDQDALNTYTYIHEFGHVLGADDYYDTEGYSDPLGGCDIMDSMSGDHNPFTKFNYGWLTSSRLIVTDTNVTVELEDFSKSGDSVIIANNWNTNLGAYQEYYIVVYYTQNGLNGDGNGYFARDGILVYHVNASLNKYTEGDEVYYDIYNNNTSYIGDYGTKNNLIEFVTTRNDTYTYVVGDSLGPVTTDSGEKLSYTFSIDKLDADRATLTFVKK